MEMVFWWIKKNYFFFQKIMPFHPNPWHVENIQAFSYFCCPECVYRSQEETSFQAHAVQNHPESSVLFRQVVAHHVQLKFEEKVSCLFTMHYCKQKAVFKKCKQTADCV